MAPGQGRRPFLAGGSRAGASAEMGTSPAAPCVPWTCSKKQLGGNTQVSMTGGQPGARQGLGGAGVSCCSLESIGAEPSSMFASLIGGDMVASQAGCPICCSKKMLTERGPPEVSPPAPHVPLWGTEARGGAQAPVHGRARGDELSFSLRLYAVREQSQSARRPSSFSDLVLCAAEQRLTLRFLFSQ